MSTTHETALIGFEKCERLLGNADVQWFIAEALAKPLAENQAKLEATAGVTRDEREIAAHICNALRAAKGFLEERRDIFKRSLPPENSPKKGA